MKRIITRIKELPVSIRIQLFAAALLTAGLLAAIPVYAWFINQKKAAEMYKVEFPNALYVNAAHREDQAYFGLDGINIDEYALDPLTGDPLLDENDKNIKVDKFRYVFSVSGSNTNTFMLQLAHTNNNLFTYTIYEAEQYPNEKSLFLTNEAGEYVNGSNEVVAEENRVFKSGISKDNVVKYSQHSNSHNENKLKIVGDDYVDDATSDLFYVMSASPVIGRYVNMSGTLASGALANPSDTYFNKTYGDYGNVEEHSVPSYWQATLNANPDSNKAFCKYFILEVTWSESQQETRTKKETDMVYISAKRLS